MQEIIITSILSSLVTAVFGVFAFIFSQIYFKYSQSFRLLKGKTVNLLTFYSNVFSNPIDIAQTPDYKLPDSHSNASLILRELAGEWRALIEMKPFMPFLPSKNMCYFVSKNLIGLSNGMVHPYNQPNSDLYSENKNKVDEISKKLNFYRVNHKNCGIDRLNPRLNIS